MSIKTSLTPLSSIFQLWPDASWLGYDLQPLTLGLLSHSLCLPDNVSHPFTSFLAQFPGFSSITWHHCTAWFSSWSHSIFKDWKKAKHFITFHSSSKWGVIKEYLLKLRLKTQLQMFLSFPHFCVHKNKHRQDLSKLLCCKWQKIHKYRYSQYCNKT